MNILFLTIGRFASIEAHSIYTDLMRCFRDHGHVIYTITPYEKKTGKKTELSHERGAHILHIETGNITSVNNLINKGLAQMSLELTYIKAIKRYFSDVKFNLVMYSTPPITFSGAVEYIKKRDGATSYLLLKDIFPQNAVDLGMMTKNGVKGLIYRHFRDKEKKLYALSDNIGCMSEANVKYVMDHNPEIDVNAVEVCPNAIEVVNQSVDAETRASVRQKYDIPLDKKVYVYGGNLGKPQGIPFFVQCLRKAQSISDVFFLVVGSGNDYGKVEAYVSVEKPDNVKLLGMLPKEDFDSVVGACDVGMIFLDYRFTIPNFPSRLLAYMQAKLPVLAVTDPNTDIGKVITDGGFGWWCESNQTTGFIKCIQASLQADLVAMGENAFTMLNENFTLNHAYEISHKRVTIRKYWLLWRASSQGKNMVVRL